MFKTPLPRIFAWPFDAANDSVEAEYIIQEKAPGVEVGSLWHQWPREKVDQASG